MEIYISVQNGKRNLIVDIRSDEDLCTKESYEERMLAENDISVFLSYRSSYIDDVERYSYDIDSMISLVDLARIRSLNLSEIVMIVESISKCRDVISEFLLSMEGLVLNPEFVFFDKKEKLLKFCFNLYNNSDVYSSYLGMGEFLLSAVNYDDEGAVKLAYDIYAAILNKDYELINLLTEDILNIAHPEKVNHETINTENIQEQNILKENNIRENSQGLSLFSVICITIDGVLMLFCILLFVFYRKLFLYFVKDIRILSVMLLIFSIIIFFPVLNILDINHAKRLSERC